MLFGDSVVLVIVIELTTEGSNTSAILVHKLLRHGLFHDLFHLRNFQNELIRRNKEEMDPYRHAAAALVRISIHFSQFF